MPRPPEDDWTRPIPRQPRADGGPTRARSTSADSTQRIPRGAGSQDTEYIPRGGQARGRKAPAASRPTDWRDGADHFDAGYPDDYDGGYADDYPVEHGRRDDSGGGRNQTPRRHTPTGPPSRPAPRRHPRGRYRVRRFFVLLFLAVLAYVVSMVVVVSMVWGSINRIDASPDVADRPVGGAGQNFLLIGTDSRAELSEEQRSDFGTGTFEGSRADTIMLLHVPSMGSPTLVSLPRDSYVEIRGYGWNKLNSAHSFGGAELLVDTVEQTTGLAVHGYLEIGFGGFVNVVDKVGGVDMCLDAPIQDSRAHIDLPAGCQELAGRDALGYVRMRYSDQRGDLGRVERQREFLSALVQKMASPSTILVPWRLHDVGTSTGEVLALGEDTSLYESARLALAMRSVAAGSGNSVTVPVANPGFMTNVGSTVLWEEQGAAELWAALRDGREVPVPDGQQ